MHLYAIHHKIVYILSFYVINKLHVSNVNKYNKGHSTFIFHWLTVNNTMEDKESGNKKS